MRPFTILLSLFFVIFAPLFEAKADIRPNNINVEVVAKGLAFPWGLAFLPNGDMLVTERDGNLRIIRQDTLEPEPLKGLPDHIFVGGQGGLLDIALHPNFSKNRLVYFSYAGREGRQAGTEVARARLSDNGTALENLEIIFKVEPKTRGRLHYGSRLVFLPDGTLLIGVGDRYTHMDEAQNPSNHLGAIMRVNDDGSIPEDNPFAQNRSRAGEIYSYGHRNIQGMTYDAARNIIWQHEHGPKGGDEVNIIKPGLNYGWPAITYGIDYDGDIISDKTELPGMEQPLIHWTPSIAPSGLAVYSGDKFKDWQGDLFVGALAGSHLRRLDVNGDQIIGQQKLLDGIGRIRDVRDGPDGYLYILTDAYEGAVLRLSPKE